MTGLYYEEYSTKLSSRKEKCHCGFLILWRLDSAHWIQKKWFFNEKKIDSNSFPHDFKSFFSGQFINCQLNFTSVNCQHRQLDWKIFFWGYRCLRPHGHFEFRNKTKKWWNVEFFQNLPDQLESNWQLHPGRPAGRLFWMPLASAECTSNGARQLHCKNRAQTLVDFH